MHCATSAAFLAHIVFCIRIENKVINCPYEAVIQRFSGQGKAVEIAAIKLPLPSRALGIAAEQNVPNGAEL
jgi:hypothetical protein